MKQARLMPFPISTGLEREFWHMEMPKAWKHHQINLFGASQPILFRCEIFDESQVAQKACNWPENTGPNLPLKSFGSQTTCCFFAIAFTSIRLCRPDSCDFTERLRSKRNVLQPVSHKQTRLLLDINEKEIGTGCGFPIILRNNTLDLIAYVFLGEYLSCLLFYITLVPSHAVWVTIWLSIISPSTFFAPFLWGHIGFCEVHT